VYPHDPGQKLIQGNETLMKIDRLTKATDGKFARICPICPLLPSSFYSYSPIHLIKNYFEIFENMILLIRA
jgi:hypothetical protein